MEMPRDVTFTVYGIPTGQGSMRLTRSRSTGRMVADHPRKTVEWRNRVASQAAEELARKEGGYRLLDGALGLVVKFFFLRPKTIPKSRARPEVQPDLDKLVRAIGDALQGVAYRNDGQIVHICADKFYGEPARMEIILFEVI